MPFRKKYWYWNIETRKPEFGRVSRTEKLLGPYRSREEAEQAPRIIAERNAQWVGQERAAAAQAAREKAERDPEAARRRAEKAASDRDGHAASPVTGDAGADSTGRQASTAGPDAAHPSSTPLSGGHTHDKGRAGASDTASPHGQDTDGDGATDRRNGGGPDANDSNDDWPSWKDFLEEPSTQELERERREGAGAPPAFFGDTSAIGVVGDDENGTFEQRVQRFNKDRSDFERQAREDEQARKARERRSAQEADRAIADNERQARRLLEQQERDLPGRVSHSLHVWKDETVLDQGDPHSDEGHHDDSRIDLLAGSSDDETDAVNHSDNSDAVNSDNGTHPVNSQKSADRATGEGR